MIKNNRPYNFFLLTENCFHTSYLVSQWVKTFQSYLGFQGILLRGNKGQLVSNKLQFHQKHYKKRQLSNEEFEELLGLYKNISKAEEKMIELFGVPSHSADSFPSTLFLGENLNSKEVETWLKRESQKATRIFIFIFLDTILNPFWIEHTKGCIINSHSAVLPYARGMFAIENLAAKGDVTKFKQAAGASVHYIDNGVDTGPILKEARINDPFMFQSLWEVKAHSYKMAFDLLIQQALEIVEKPEVQFLGVKPDPLLVGPAFRSRDFTPNIRKYAEEQFISMRQMENRSSTGI
ncbi:formyl transferase [Lucifera butyrica]|uniref:Formyl transferase n=1 Tax=Lucifera butyrica TaxID=1351585 RepID=A0A498R105_9FIRM|nr:formyltransferase family protein [Lucifera butyrica]VBB05124.1 formyl transferase [Lucifera butyrica]